MLEPKNDKGVRSSKVFLCKLSFCAHIKTSKLNILGQMKTQIKHEKSEIEYFWFEG